MKKILDDVIGAKSSNINKKENQEAQEFLLLKQNNSEEVRDAERFLEIINLDHSLNKLREKTSAYSKLDAFKQSFGKETLTIKDLKDFCFKNNYRFSIAQNYKGHVDPIEISKAFFEFQKNVEENGFKVNVSARNFLILAPEEDFSKNVSDSKKSQCVLFYREVGSYSDISENDIITKVATFGNDISFFRRYKLFFTNICSDESVIKGDSAPMTAGFILLSILLMCSCFFNTDISQKIYSALIIFAAFSALTNNDYKYIEE